MGRLVVEGNEPLGDLGHKEAQVILPGSIEAQIPTFVVRPRHRLPRAG